MRLSQVWLESREIKLTYIKGKIYFQSKQFWSKTTLFTDSNQQDKRV